MMWLVSLVLQFTLELHANLDSLKGMCSGDSAAGCYAASNESAARYETSLVSIFFPSYVFACFCFYLDT